MKIVIVGPGAMGCLLAAFLSKTKEDIWIFDYNKERAAKITQGGISLTGISGEWLVKAKASSEIKDIGTADLLIVCVKSYDTKTAITHAKPLVGEGTEVLTLQNGLGNIEIISEVAGADKVIGGVTNLGATLLDIGKAKHAGKGETIIGRIDGKMTAQMRSIREIFNKVGLETRISKDIKSLLWSKLIINAGINALTAVTRLNNGKLTEFEGTRRIMREAVTEAVRIAKRKRIKLIYDDPLAKVEAVCEATAGNVSSMLQDILRKKRTEIDFINAVIVRLGQELNIPVPTNTMLVDLVKTIETSYNYAISCSK
ncbi:MAG: 2-dehydropantoate 2-reductase [Candidatus Omnitrophota bacterium]|nr:2-dehydropantoate 2-reductase [Candidatus Omnitrophota bacterium]